MVAKTNVTHVIADPNQSSLCITHHTHTHIQMPPVKYTHLISKYDYSSAGRSRGSSMSATCIHLSNQLTVSTHITFVHRRGDVVFSLACGIGAYFLYERDHPREWTLKVLVQRKVDRVKTEGWFSDTSK